VAGKNASFPSAHLALTWYSKAAVLAKAEALGMTQEELGLKIGRNKLTISRWERGAMRPNRKALEALDRLLREARRKGVVLSA
jgi:ribosome-binding protein aMBF1 (putative translation factor)